MIVDLLLGFGLVIVLAGAVVWGWPALRRGWRGVGVRAALLLSRDGRYAVKLADALQAGSRRIRRVVQTLEPDPAEREAVLAMLRQFTGDELDALLWQMRLLLATGDNERIRALHRQMDEQTEAWSRQADGPARERAAADLAELRQEIETRRQTGRAWAVLVRGLEQAGRDLEALERELVVLGVAKQQPLSAFSGRIAESIENLRRIRAAHAELDSPT
jgi:hypothetical protein